MLSVWPYYFDRGGRDWGVDVAAWRGDTVFALFWSYTDASSGDDWALVKLDQLGNPVWILVDTLPAQQFPRGLALDSSGNAYISFLDRQGTGVRRSGLAKVSPQGVVLWRRYRLIHDSSDAYDVAVDQGTGRVYVAGTAFFTDLSGTHEEIFLWRLDTLGNDLGVSVWNSGGLWFDVDIAKAVAVGRGDTVIVGGETRDAYSDFHAVLVFFRGSDGTALKADTLSEVESSYEDCVEGITVDRNSGKIYIVGRTLSSTQISWVVCRTSSGPLWRRFVGSGTQWKLYGIAQRGNYIAVSGLTDSLGSVDLAVVFLDTLGNRLYDSDSVENRGTEDEVWDDVAILDYGCVALVGRVSVDGYAQVICPQYGVGEGGARAPLRAWPNPFTGSLRVEGSEGPFKVYDATGKLVRVYKLSPLGEDLRPGVYFLEAGSRRLRVVKLH